MAELKLENIKVKRESFNLEIPLLCVSAGKILGVQGKSGSGKSTLLNAIAGFEPLEEGTILFDGKIISALPTELRRVAIVFQRPALFSHLNVLDNVCFGLKVQGMRLAERQKKGRYWLERFGLGHLCDRFPHEISGGEAQRVALARSVVVGFPVLLLDEPFSALDVESKIKCRMAVKEVVKELSLAVILVSHDAEDIQSLADDYCLLELGKMIKFDSVKK